MTDAPGSRHADPRVARVIGCFEHLQMADLAQLHTIYADDATFKDPFHELRGRDAIEAVYRRMFDTLDAPRFTIVDALAQGEQCFMTWEFRFKTRGRGGAPHLVRGGTHLRFAADGRIAMHRDYWDPAEELYESLPLVGALMRWLKRRIAA